MTRGEKPRIAQATRDDETTLLARHFETEKNLRDIHGTSDLDALTPAGVGQLERLGRFVGALGVNRFEGVTATPTPQAVASATQLSHATGLPLEPCLSLTPVTLGVASGLSTDELSRTDPDAFKAMDAFRSRVIAAQELQIPGGETAIQIETRLVRWWQDEGYARLPGRIVVGSNSTVLMISRLLDGILPTDSNYRYLAVPNGSWRFWTLSGNSWTSLRVPSESSWPDVAMEYLRSSAGLVATTRHFPNWAPTQVGVVILPGYFGSSRHGPYGLYNRLASHWAQAGFETTCIDPLGSGDSSPIHRTFDSEVESARAAAASMLERKDHVVVVGHSMGGATALAARRRLSEPGRASVFALAPLCRFADLSQVFLSPNDQDELVKTGRCFRHGLELRMEMIKNSEAAWTAFASEIDRIWVAGSDVYTTGVEYPTLPSGAILAIEDADHNFSNRTGVAELAASTLFQLIQMTDH